jgi:flagellar biosynthesis/type III secretory pathway M-ring protein FliF/YscJ
MNVMNTLPVSAMVLADLTELNTNLVTPGVLGFLVIFGIALVLYFLMRSMTSKLTPLAEQREAEKAAQEEGPQEQDTAGKDVADKDTDTGDRPKETGKDVPATSTDSEEQTRGTSR